MEQEQLYVKNMVCQRCIQAVGDELDSLGIDFLDIQLGQVKINKALDSMQVEQVKKALSNRGFELLEDRNSKFIEQIKTAIIDLIHNSEAHTYQNISTYLENKLAKDYNYLSNLFSSVENITIEKFLILQRVEKVKELLVYNELTLSEISYKMKYSSVQYLSAQFRKVTGMSPSEFKKLSIKKRVPLDKVIRQ